MGSNQVRLVERYLELLEEAKEAAAAKEEQRVAILEAEARGIAFAYNTYEVVTDFEWLLKRYAWYMREED